MQPGLVESIEAIRKEVGECLDLMVQLDVALTSAEKVLKHWPQAATLKKSLEKK